MPKISVLNVKGEKVKDIKLNDNVWGIKPNDPVLHNSLVLATVIIFISIIIFMDDREEFNHTSYLSIWG